MKARWYWLIFVILLVISFVFFDEYNFFSFMATIWAIVAVIKTIRTFTNGYISPRMAEILFWPFDPPDSISRNYVSKDEVRYLPRCAHCFNLLSKDMKWAAVVEMKNGARLLFCCARCKSDYEIENGLRFQHLGSGMFREV